MRVNIIREVRKRSGQLVPFNQEKIANAIFKAAQAVGGEDRQMADELADVVTMFLEKQYGPGDAAALPRAPTIEEIQDMVEKVLIETGHAKTAKAYILYRERRARIRDTVKVRKQIAGRNNPTDLSLLVDPATRDEIRSWNKQLIALALEKEADVPAPVAAEIITAPSNRRRSTGRWASSSIRSTLLPTQRIAWSAQPIWRSTSITASICCSAWGELTSTTCSSRSAWRASSSVAWNEATS
jgi:ribonucleoside-triphosphate reductase